jgi:cell division protein FtsA
LENGKNILALDVGSTKICAIIAEIRGSNDVRIIGAGVEKSQGLKRGSITNIDLASKSIKSAVEDARRVAGTNETEVVVSISGAYVKSVDSSGIINVPSGEVGINEINRVMQTARYNANIPSDYDILHILPYNFKVDEQDFVEDPLGMNASRLEVFTHLIITTKSNFNNLKRSVEMTGLKVSNVVLNSYASYIATINSDEKSLGIGIIDMGGNTSSFVIHAGGNAVRYQGFLGVGSNHITNDLSMALHTPVTIAENVKITYGNLTYLSDDLIELPVIGDENTTHEVSLDVVGQVIRARVSETLELVSKQIDDSGLRREIGGGFVLTGGLTKLEGIRELAMSILNAPVRLAKPKPISGLFESLRDPAFSTSIGLIMHTTGSYALYEFDANGNMRYNRSIASNQNKPTASLHDIAMNNYSSHSQVKHENLREVRQPANNINNTYYGGYNNNQPPAQTIGINGVGNIPNQIPQPEKTSNSNNQPIEAELKSQPYYNRSDNPIGNGINNQNSGINKAWQWITQLF